MTEDNQDSFWGSFFSFNLTTIAGILIGVMIFLFSSETHPIWSYLFSPTLYIVTTMIAVTIRLILWLTLERGAIFEFSHIIGQMIKEVIIINLVLLSTLSFLFLLTTYVLA